MGSIAHFLRIRFIWLFCLFTLVCTFEGCSTDESLEPTECGVTVDYDGSLISFCPEETDSLIREQDLFIWQAMNLFYLDQDQVPSLADDAFEDYEALYDYLNGFSSSEDLYEYGILSNSDRFSEIFENYRVIEDAFQGTSTSFGYEFRLLRETEGSNEIFGYVAYVVEGGPADQAGLSRGDVFNKVNGVQLTEDNFEEALFGVSSYEITLATIQDNVIASTNSTIFLAAIPLTEDPIFLSKVFETGGVKVGYLVYNQFVNNNEALHALNNVFGHFKSEGVSELVLDLRYNPGGSVFVARVLASLIYATNSMTELGSSLYNEKLEDYFNSTLYFFESLPVLDEERDVIVSSEPLNALEGLSRLYVLTSSATASTAEFLIVGLSTYLDIVTVGTTTVGENEASVILYDSRTSLYLSDAAEDVNSSHNYAIQPVVSRLSNSEGFVDYSGGLEPDLVIDEKNFLENLQPLGEEGEPLLSAALSIISGEAKPLRSRRIGDSFAYLDKKRAIREKAILEVLSQKKSIN